MNKLHKILLGIFCVGVFLTGIGAGVMFTEFSSLTYGGKQIIGKTTMCTKQLDVEFEPGEETCYIGGWYDWDQEELLTDRRVPVNTVRFSVTYNEDRIMPCAYWNKEAHEITLTNRWIGDDDVELLLEAKDQLLKNLKEGRIVSFDAMDVEEVTVTVNPANAEDIRLVW